MKKYLIALSFLFVAFGCTDDDKLNVLFEDLETGSYIQIVDSQGDIVVNKTDPDNSNFSITYQAISVENGADVNSVDLFVAFSDETVAEGDPDFSADPVLLRNIPSSTFDTSGEFPRFTVNFNANEILQALGLTAAQTDGSDIFRFNYVVNTDRGSFGVVSAEFDGQSADHDFNALVVCNLAIVPAGVWTIDMTDTFGDGWQTTSSGGGPGITVTLDDGTVFEVGLCSTATPSPFDCTMGPFEGTATITIPPGTTSAVWNFPGDFFGEITFTITSPSGNVVAEYGTGGPAGPIPLNLCNE